MNRKILTILIFAILLFVIPWPLSLGVFGSGFLIAAGAVLVFYLYLWRRRKEKQTDPFEKDKFRGKLEFLSIEIDYVQRKLFVSILEILTGIILIIIALIVPQYIFKLQFGAPGLVVFVLGVYDFHDWRTLKADIEEALEKHID